MVSVLLTGICVFIRSNLEKCTVISYLDSRSIRGGSRAAATSKIEWFVIIVNSSQLSAVNYYHKALHLGSCSSPRSAAEHNEKFSEDLDLGQDSASSRSRSIHCVKNLRFQSFSGLYFPAFALNTEIYGVNLLT